MTAVLSPYRTAVVSPYYCSIVAESVGVGGARGWHICCPSVTLVTMVLEGGPGRNHCLRPPGLRFEAFSTRSSPCQAAFEARLTRTGAAALPGGGGGRAGGQEGGDRGHELFNRNNFSIRYWSWNYRGCCSREGSASAQAPRHAPGVGGGGSLSCARRVHLPEAGLGRMQYGVCLPCGRSAPCRAMPCRATRNPVPHTLCLARCAVEAPLVPAEPRHPVPSMVSLTCVGTCTVHVPSFSQLAQTCPQCSEPSRGRVLWQDCHASPALNALEKLVEGTRATQEHSEGSLNAEVRLGWYKTMRPDWM